MKTQRNMKRRRSLFSPVVLSLIVGMIGGLVWSGTSGQAAQTAKATTVDSTLQIPVTGTVTDPNATISVSGYVTVNCTMVPGTTLATPPASPPSVELTFDFSNVYGSSGTTIKTLMVYVTGGNQDIRIRPLQASDVIPITCPYFNSNAGILTAKAWLVTTTLNFDLSTGKLTSGSATAGNNPTTF